MGNDNKFRIGVDVGGTNTDSVIIDITQTNDPITRGVVATFKHETTVDITTGIEFAVKKVLELAEIDHASDRILSLTIGTTHFINAIVQLDVNRLAKVAVIRLAAPYTTECPPFIDFPGDLREIMNGHTAVLHGGLQIDGRIINDLREHEILEQANIIRSKGLKNIVLVGVYSPLDVEGKTEYKVRDILLKELGQDVNIVCSRDVGHVGLLERENASILNASILSFARKTIRGYQKAMKRLGLSCPLYLTQNDGTLTTAAEAARLPIRTFSSGATNSMRGASYLAGIDLKKQESSGKNIIVVDVGGTTTDVGVLLPSGFPRQAAAFIEVAGVRTNFSMPDVHSIGLGGGSRIRFVENGQVTVGPDSVGHQLTKDALVFGGQILTATDIAVRAGGFANLGDPTKVADISKESVTKVHDNIKHLLERVVDRMKTSPEDCDLLLVGGGSILAPTSLRGVANIILPKFHQVANAVGAAIASVSGGIDTIEILQGKSLSETLTRIKQQAIDNAVKSGADKATARIADVNILPVQYVTNQATRIIVRAVGELAGEAETVHFDQDGVPGLGEDDDDDDDDTSKTNSIVHNPQFKKEKMDYKTYKPNVVGDDWNVSETDLFFIMEGCGVLGTGGGGSPYSTYLSCSQILRGGGSIHIVDHGSLEDNDVIARGGFMGSPSVGSERLRSAAHLRTAGLELAKYCGITKFSATLCDEIGGSNGMQSLLMTKYFDVPALDGDLMGRAYPLLNQVLPAVYNQPNSLVPCSLNDGDGNTVILSTVKNDHFVESIMRVVTTEMGSSAALCPPPLAMHIARDFGVTRSLSQAWRIGRAIAICRQTNEMNGITSAILELQEGKCLFVGKIVDVSREVRAGFTWGQVRIKKLRQDEVEYSTENLGDAVDDDDDDDDDATVVIPFQNENLCAYMEKNDGTRTVMASVPDLITILDSQSGSHLGTPEYTYGLRVTVIALAGHPLWRSKIGLEVGGPIAFGLSHTFEPIGEYREPKSVIKEYGNGKKIFG